MCASIKCSSTSTKPSRAETRRGEGRGGGLAGGKETQDAILRRGRVPSAKKKRLRVEVSSLAATIFAIDGFPVCARRWETFLSLELIWYRLASPRMSSVSFQCLDSFCNPLVGEMRKNESRARRVERCYCAGKVSLELACIPHFENSKRLSARLDHRHLAYLHASILLINVT